jgi:hypothetical protein
MAPFSTRKVSGCSFAFHPLRDWPSKRGVQSPEALEAQPVAKLNIRKTRMEAMKKEK